MAGAAKATKEQRPADVSAQVLADLRERAPAIISAVDDVLETGVRRSTDTAKALATLNDAMRLAREHPEVRERLRFLFAAVGAHADVSGAYTEQLAQLKADAAALAQ